MALVKYNNNSISAVTSAASIPSGAMTLIKTLTARSSSTLSFVNGSSDVVLDSTYPIYKFVYTSIHAATEGAAFQFNMTLNGSDYNVTKTTTFFEALHNESGSASNLTYETGEDLAQGTGFQNLIRNFGNGNDECASGELMLFNPSSTTFVKHFISRSSGHHQSDYNLHEFVAGYGNTTSAVTGVRFQMNSGNIDAGKIKLYGIKDS